MKKLLVIVAALVAIAMPANAKKVVLGTPRTTTRVMVEELANDGGVRIKPETGPSKVIEATFDSEVFDYGNAWMQAWKRPGKPIVVKSHTETKRLDLIHFLQTPHIDTGVLREGNSVLIVRDKKLGATTTMTLFPAFVYIAGILFLASYLTVWLAKRREKVSSKEADSMCTVILATGLLAWASTLIACSLLEGEDLRQALITVTTILASSAVTWTIAARLAEKKVFEFCSFCCGLVFFGIGTWVYLSF